MSTAGNPDIANASVGGPRGSLSDSEVNATLIYLAIIKVSTVELDYLPTIATYPVRNLVGNFSTLPVLMPTRLVPARFSWAI